jgi:lipoate-protein ligase A
LPGAYLAPLQAEELRATAALREEKFSQEDWIFGYSPAYLFQQQIQLPAGLLDIKMRIDKGRISEAAIALDGNSCNLAIEAIQGCYHHALPLDDLAVLLPAGLALDDFLRSMY